MISILVLGGCQPDEVNRSRFRRDLNSAFIIRSIEAGDNGEFYCVGLIHLTDTTVVMKYDQDLNRIHSTAIQSLPQFAGQTVLTRNGSGWLISEVLKTGNQNEVYLHQTDEAFAILHSQLLYSQLTPVGRRSGTVDEIVAANGAITVVLDTGRINSLGNYENYGYKLMCLNPDLSIRYSFPTNGIVQTKTQILPSGEVFYCGNSITTQPQLVYGLIDPTGQERYQNVMKRDVQFAGMIGVASTSKGMVIQRVANSDQLLIYNLIEPQFGDPIKETVIAENHLNFDVFGGNPLPAQLTGENGLALLNHEKLMLEYLTFDEDLNPSLRFTARPHGIPWIQSFRQLHTTRNTVIIGQSLEDRGNYDFVLQEFEMNGELVE
ncbi:MAG: hypothetical protein H6608_05325 [Flavobacteriales bacterium]|nr:hypothetical protein [Flavobacteriales bacterium]